MTDPITTSKSARENLARGLNALQSDASVPPAVTDLAAPIAQAMGALHQLERTNQLVPHAEVALGHLRGALAELQKQLGAHQAVEVALEAVASSLNLVHMLNRMAMAPAAPPSTPSVERTEPMPAVAPLGAAVTPPRPAVQPKTVAMAQAPARPIEVPAPTPVVAPAPVALAPAPVVAAPVAAPPAVAPAQPVAPAPVTAPVQAVTAPVQAVTAPVQAVVAPAPAPVAAPAPAPAPVVARDPFAAPSAPAMAAAPPAPMAAPVPPPSGNLQLVSADLGAHSATNFFKGLAGNDIIDHGGIFISTYVLPKIGHVLRVKVSLPGGYEFEANATVRWTREDAGFDAPPGFGAQFTQITPEARQLVYRYVRNREPMFYDDL